MRLILAALFVSLTKSELLSKRGHTFTKEQAMEIVATPDFDSEVS